MEKEIDSKYDADLAKLIIQNKKMMSIMTKLVGRQIKMYIKLFIYMKEK